MQCSYVNSLRGEYMEKDWLYRTMTQSVDWDCQGLTCTRWSWSQVEMWRAHLQLKECGVNPFCDLKTSRRCPRSVDYPNVFAAWTSFWVFWKVLCFTHCWPGGEVWVKKKTWLHSCLELSTDDTSTKNVQKWNYLFLPMQKSSGLNLLNLWFPI